MSFRHSLQRIHLFIDRVTCQYHFTISTFAEETYFFQFCRKVHVDMHFILFSLLELINLRNIEVTSFNTRFFVTLVLKHLKSFEQFSDNFPIEDQTCQTFTACMHTALVPIRFVSLALQQGTLSKIR